MRPRDALFSFAEQMFASSFNFFALVVAARMLVPDALSIYTAFFSLNQSFSFFLMGLILFPLASSSSADIEQQLSTSVVLLCFLLIGFTLLAPLAMSMFDSFVGRIDFINWAVAAVFFASQCIFETMRWLSIRLRGARVTLPVTVTRFVLFFGGLFLLKLEHFSGIVFALAQVAINLMAALGYGLGLKLLRKIKLHMPDRNAVRQLAIFGNSFGSFITNFTAVTLIDRVWGGAGLLAFQAMKSATNPIGIISQLIDNHFSASTAKNDQKVKYGAHHILIALVITGFLVTLSIPIAPWAIRFALGETFIQWWPLFPSMLLASLAHTITRPIFVNWRLCGDIWALNFYTKSLIFIITPIMILFYVIEMPQLFVLVFAMQSLTCFFPLILKR